MAAIPDQQNENLHDQGGNCARSSISHGRYGKWQCLAESTRPLEQYFSTEAQWAGLLHYGKVSHLLVMN